MDDIHIEDKYFRPRFDDSKIKDWEIKDSISANLGFEEV